MWAPRSDSGRQRAPLAPKPRPPRSRHAVPSRSSPRRPLSRDLRAGQCAAHRAERKTRGRSECSRAYATRHRGLRGRAGGRLLPMPVREHRGCAWRPWSRALAGRAETACGVVAGPLFVGAFTAIGRRRTGYNWRRHAVSSLARGPQGWSQRANFTLAGGLYCLAAHGLAQRSGRTGEPPVVAALVLAAGVGLIGSGLFVTDPVAGFPPLCR
jgi:Protein of unknown function (DUF998)